MGNKLVKVFLDIDNGDGCWNCKNDCGGICAINHSGTVGYVYGVSICALTDWELKTDD